MTEEATHQLHELLEEGFIVERPYAQAYLLLGYFEDWRKQTSGREPPYYGPLQRFENALRKAKLVPPAPSLPSGSGAQYGSPSGRRGR